MPPKAKAGKKHKAQPISGLDVDALLKSDSKRRKLDHHNAIPEFVQMVQYSENVKGVEEAVNQMGTVIRTLVTDSTGDSAYDRAIEHLGVLRGQMISMEEPALYNSFIKDFKKRLLQGDFNGNRKELWWIIKRLRMGLIDSNASENSDVTTDEAVEVSEIPIGSTLLTVTDYYHSFYKYHESGGSC